MASKFASSVEHGLMLSKRIYYGKGVAAPPAPPPPMSKSPESFLPTAPMAYAVVHDPSAVDNPDVPSYQPYVHGRCDPPALIPLHMHEVSMEIDCSLDAAVVRLAGRWRVHCIMSGGKCDVQVAIPMGEQGLLLGIEVDVEGRTYSSQLIIKEDTEDMSAEAAKAKDGQEKAKDGQFLRFQTFIFRVPQAEGGSTLSVKANWSQKLTYHDGRFSLRVPFSFPAYVNPVFKKMRKKERVLLHVNSGTGIELVRDDTSHLLRELQREAGKLSVLYEAEVPTWSNQDFKFSYSVSPKSIAGGLFLQAPSMHDVDQREMFYCYLYPGNNPIGKVHRKEIVYVIDISASMQNLLINVKNALLGSLSKLNQKDSFNIIAFNNEVHLFSSSMESATEEAISRATHWISITFTASGGTDILPPLEQAIKLLAETTESIPLIFLVTDGTVENEWEICHKMKSHCSIGLPTYPRIYSFGIGAYCNHYFLQTLSQIGKGHHDAAYDGDSIEFRMKKLLGDASSIIMTDMALDVLEKLDSLEMYPSVIPDLSSGRPLILSGRYSGKFPEFAKASGVLADGSVFAVDLKVQRVKELPLDRVLARRQIDGLTAQAWLQKSTELKEKVVGMSLQLGIPSEYTFMVLCETFHGKITSSVQGVQQKLDPQMVPDSKGQKILVLGSLGKGFGNLTATLKNIPPEPEEKSSDAAEALVKAATNCCGRLMDRICCMCFIRTCSKLNDQCTIIFAQLCAGLACFECINCCFEICDCCSCLS